MEVLIRKSQPEDVKEILNLIKELAAFEEEPDAVLISESDIIEQAFSENPLIYIFVAEWNEEILGIAVYFYSFSTWKGKSIHLEDLIVKEVYRKNGIGKKLMFEVLKVAKEEKVGRMDWEVLDWNQGAIQFYKKLGTTFFNDWNLCRLYKEDIENIKF